MVGRTFLSVRIRECRAFLPGRADSSWFGGTRMSPTHQLDGRQECLPHRCFSNPPQFGHAPRQRGWAIFLANRRSHPYSLMTEEKLSFLWQCLSGWEERHWRCDCHEYTLCQSAEVGGRGGRCTGFTCPRFSHRAAPGVSWQRRCHAAR